VWIGFDDKRKSLGTSEQGSLAALPMWMEFMQAYIAARPDKDDPPEFQVPGNIVFLPVDKTSGALQPAGSVGAIDEAFIAGTQPGGLNHSPF
jgi:penicillin-binding protein 1A